MRQISVVAIAIALAATAAESQTSVPGSVATRSATVIRAQLAPSLDGRLDEAVWASVPTLTDFIQREPNEGAPAEDDTEVRFLYTDDALYIGARMFGNPAEIRTNVARRDDNGEADHLIISFDTFRDRRTAYTFVVTAAGGRVDYLHPNDQEFNRDYSFDPVWEAEAAVDGQGWTAEVRIPFTQLRFSPADQQVWGVNLKRVSPALSRESFWQLIRRDETGWSSRMGEMAGITGIRPGRRIELQPYVATAGKLVSGVDPDDPFEDPRDVSFRVGGDVKVGLGPNLTLDATFNPDFGQVEGDPAVVNLSAFETFFAERRPFFTEGSRIFSIGNLFYSRRIGASPRGGVNADYSQRLDNSTILGAAKVTGQLASGLSIGVLTALTDQEKVATYDVDENQFGRVVVEPLTGYGVVRLEKQYGSNSSTVGGILTGVRRNLPEEGSLPEILNSSAVTGGLDGRFRWLGGMYDLNWSVLGSHVRGSTDAILAQQRSSRRYFQRPDADHVEVDPSRTSLSGYKISIGHSRTGAAHWLWDLDFAAESPGYETNDIGSIGSVDGLYGYAGLTYRETNPGSILRNYSMGVFSSQEFNYDGDWISSWIGANINGRLLNYWGSTIGVDYFPQAQSASLTRGGPLMKRIGVVEPFLAINSPSGRKFETGLSFGTSISYPVRSFGYEIGTNFSYRPTPRLQLSIDPEYSRRPDVRQYVATRSNGPAATFGSRYIFARIHRSEISAALRANYAIGPDLTLEAYLEPFASTGTYSNFGELVAPRTHDLLTYGTGGTTIERSNDEYTVTQGASTVSFGDPAFHVRSFRSNAVLRWEWRPGSTLFVVWQQNREGDGLLDDHVDPSDLLDSVKSDGDNFLTIKATYWLPW